jgi:hypothetical protein
MREAESSAAVVAQPGRQGLTASQCAFERPLVDDGDLVAALSALRRDVMLGRIGTKVALTALAISQVPTRGGRAEREAPGARGPG